MATLREARCQFTLALARLLLFAHEQGYDVALDEVTERLTEKDQQSDHRPGSLHHSGLAADVLLYKDGQYLSKTSDYVALGEWWEGEGRARNYPLAWGGRFNDGNHFSYAWNGKK